MRKRISLLINAPIAQVFAFFDDPRNPLEFQEHARTHVEGIEVVEARPDGRRVFDLRMRAGSKRWVQTIDQTQRDVPTGLVSRAWSWTRDRDHPLSIITTERRFEERGDATQLDVTVEHQIVDPWRHPLAVLINVVWGNAAGSLELEHGFHVIGEHLEAQARRAP